MRRRPIPGTGLEVSVLCLGTMTFGMPVAASEAVRLCHWAFEHGLNFIDTANSYEGYARFVGSSGGVAEEIVGAALRGRRDEVVVATKVGMAIGPADDDRGLGPAHIRREIDRSLRRLGTGRIDLYYLHRPDLATPLAETIEAMDGLVASGKIGHWGISNFDAAQTAEVLAACDANGWRRPVAAQPAYSLLKRDIEAGLLPLCAREGLAVVPYQVLQGGLLTGKYRGGGAPAGSRLEERPEWLQPLTGELIGRLSALESEAAGKGRSLLAHALIEALDRPGVTSLVVGAKRPEQLAAMLAAIAG